MTVLAERMNRLGTESAFEVLNQAKKLEAQGKSVIHLEIGQPDFKTPEHIIEAAYRAMKEGYTGYTPSQGLLETREAIAQYIRAWKHVPTNPDEIVVVPGGKPIMFFTILALVNPGDEVLYPNPGFPIYESVIRFAGGVPVPIPLLQENEFKIDPDYLKKHITKKTKLLILNNPSNPTGGYMEKDDILKIAEIVETTGIYVLSDEIYDRLIFGGKEPFSIASLPELKEKTVILDGFSKTYAMTGWRLGYGVMNEELAAAVTLLMINSNSCAAAFSQIAAIEALKGPQDAVETMRNAFEERCAYMVAALNEIPKVRCVMPKGAFYAFPNIAALNCPDIAKRLLHEAGVASLSGETFGEYGKGQLRFSAANSMENLREAMNRIRKFVEKI